MATKIVVAGATGNLGARVAKALIHRGGEVIALARNGAANDKVDALKRLGAKVAVVDMTSAAEIAGACVGADCVVSTLAGLRDVIVDTQSVLLEAATRAGVPRFIPSDFCTDFTQLVAGENRNYDLRREFRARLDALPIAATTIFNGAFAEVLTYSIPLLDFKKKVVGYWDDADWRIDFTTMDDTAAYTAAAALDPTSPRFLRISSFQISPRELLAFTSDTLKTPFTLVRLGSRADLRAYNERERAAHPEGERELYPRWQQSQYMLSMFGAQNEPLDNSRYPDLGWTKLEDVIKPRA